MVFEIGGIQKVTLVDYPGKIACTFFCAGVIFGAVFAIILSLLLEGQVRIILRKRCWVF